MAFVTFSLRSEVAWGTHLAFAVDRRHGEVTRVRTIQLSDELVRGKEVTLTACAESKRAVSPLDTGGQGNRIVTP